MKWSFIPNSQEQSVCYAKLDTVNYETLNMIYYGILSSILMYGSQIWGHQDGVVKKDFKFFKIKPYGL